MTDIKEMRQDIKNRLCIEGHLNIAHSSIMRSDSPDGTFCIIGALARHAVDMSFDAMLDKIDALVSALQMTKHIVDTNGTQEQLDQIFDALESVGVKP